MGNIWDDLAEPLNEPVPATKAQRRNLHVKFATFVENPELVALISKDDAATIIAGLNRAVGYESQRGEISDRKEKSDIKKETQMG